LSVVKYTPDEHHFSVLQLDGREDAVSVWQAGVVQERMAAAHVAVPAADDLDAAFEAGFNAVQSGREVLVVSAPSRAARAKSIGAILQVDKPKKAEARTL
jgi:hypothetical protein